MSSSKPRGLLVPSTAPPPPGSVIVLVCHDDHQKVKGFLLRCGSWGSVPHLVRSGSAAHIVAIWHVLSGGFNAPLLLLLRFLAVFQFSMPSF